MTCPPVGLSSAAKMFKSVVFPEPDSPMIATYSPSSTEKERFFNEQDYIRLKDTYILDLKKLEKSKSDLIVMHPLPRVNEIAIEVDDDPRAKYFDQVQNGRFMRMALILKMLGLENEVER